MAAPERTELMGLKCIKADFGQKQKKNWLAVEAEGDSPGSSAAPCPAG